MHLNGFACITTSTALLTFLCLITEDQLIAALRDVRVNVPHAVRRGEKATLMCYYDMEGDSLYSVKWYKGRREFYRYTPKETPAMKVFQFAGVRVERSASNESQLVLESVNMATTGKYSCEVSADAPSFHTLISAGELEVVEVPGKDPIISGIRSRYRIGDIVRGNCTSRHSKPAANLTWTINGYETNPSHIRHYKVPKDAREMETSISGIHFVVTPQHFVYGKLKIRCTAHIHDVYWKSTEKSIEQERHKHSTSGTNINFVNSFSEDYFDLDDENVGDRSDTYMTHIKGDVSSLNSNSAAKSTVLIATMPGAASFVLLVSLLLYAMQHLFMQCCLKSAITTKTIKSSIRTIRITAKGQHLRVANVLQNERNVERRNAMEIKEQQQPEREQKHTHQVLKQHLLIIKKINNNENDYYYKDNNNNGDTDTDSTNNLCRVQQATLERQQKQLPAMEVKRTTTTMENTPIRRTTTTTPPEAATRKVYSFKNITPSSS